MQTSNGTYSHDANDPSRRGHSSHLSISDDSHHVTEAIGYMYDDGHDRRDSKRLSYVSSPLGEAISTPARRDSPPASGSVQQQTLPVRTSSTTNSKQNGKAREQPTTEQGSPDRESSGQLSPALSRAASTKKAANSMPLNDIDYDSDPATVAQELNNLAALRRMSMDVGAADPDLPVMGKNASMPSLAPSASADEDDASRLFWVPAHVHPGLAPNEFKSFLQDKTDQIKRRSGDSSGESPSTPLQREKSAGSLQRKKSMLSRQVDSSGGSGRSDSPQPDSAADQSSDKTTGESTTSNFAEEDFAILPPAPPGNTLRRSTRTTYRKGSFKSGERVGPSRRVPRPSDSNAEHTRQTSTSSEEPPILGLTRVATDPTDGIPNHTRSAARARSPEQESGSLESAPSRNKSPVQKGAADTNDPGSSPARSASTSSDTAPPTQPYIPERKSSHELPPPTSPPQAPLPPEPSPSRSSKRAGIISSSSKDSSKSLDDIVSQPSPLPGSSTRTDTLSFIPTAAEEKKSESKKSKDKKESESGGRKSTWHWRRQTEDKSKDKKKDDDDGKKNKSKILRSSGEKQHDNARLDVLQTSIDGAPKGRESLTLERTESRVDEDERRKDSGKKSTGGEGKKEKESSIFSSFFGGSKRKLAGNDSQKKSARNPSPEPRLPVLKPDIDYNWTRFSILEERAIYRMAHIKLANPRRALYSQVLLSNFMYSYLAKVQQMHPQMTMSTGQDQQGKDDQPEEYTQYQRYQEMQDQGDYNDSFYSDDFDYDRDDRHTQYGDRRQQQYGLYQGSQYDDDEDERMMW